ncbi:MAG TPA: hypothetical protein VFR15_12315, partial [Chloroflexia bacterium]|nr:hypothetical protein [Chloroflexia bacterium]
AFALRFGGVTYAQFLTSDLVLHVHNVQSVLQGVWVFTEPVPDGTLVPYPPAYYMIVGMLSWLFGQSEEILGLLLKWTASVLDASACLALAWAGARVWSARAGAWAAAAYAASPAAFDLFSAGNYTNIFAQSVLNLTLLLGVAYLGSRARWSWAAPGWLALGFGLTMLGHYGMMLGALVILAFFLVWAVVNSLQRHAQPRAWVVLGAAGLALGASVALYFWRLADLILNQWGGVLSRLTVGQTAAQQSRPGAGDLLGRLLRQSGDLVGWISVISGVGGLAMWGRTAGGARALIGSALAASLVFAALDQLVGDAVRWYYMAAVPLALPAGIYLARLALVRKTGIALALLVAAVMGWQALTFWISLIFTRYH